MLLVALMTAPNLMAMEEEFSVQDEVPSRICGGARKLNCDARLSKLKETRDSAEKFGPSPIELLFEVRERLCRDILSKKYAELRRARRGRGGNSAQIKKLEFEIEQCAIEAFQYEQERKSFFLDAQRTNAQKGFK